MPNASAETWPGQFLPPKTSGLYYDQTGLQFVFAELETLLNIRPIQQEIRDKKKCALRHPWNPRLTSL